MEYFSKCVPPDNLLVTEDPQTSSSWSIWDMEELRFILKSYNPQYRCYVFVTVSQVSRCHPGLLGFLLKDVSLPVDFSALPQLLHGHSEDSTSGLYCKNIALGSSSHILTCAFLRRRVRACSCAPLTDETLHPAFLWGRAARWSTKTYQMLQRLYVIHVVLIKTTNGLKMTGPNGVMGDVGSSWQPLRGDAEVSSRPGLLILNIKYQWIVVVFWKT